MRNSVKSNSPRRNGMENGDNIVSEHVDDPFSIFEDVEED